PRGGHEMKSALAKEPSVSLRKFSRRGGQRCHHLNTIDHMSTRERESSVRRLAECDPHLYQRSPIAFSFAYIDSADVIQQDRGHSPKESLRDKLHLRGFGREQGWEAIHDKSKNLVNRQSTDRGLVERAVRCAVDFDFRAVGRSEGKPFP